MVTEAESKMMGKFGKKVLNTNGRKLIKMCEENNFEILNGFYWQKKIYKYTWDQDSKVSKSSLHDMSD